MTEINRLFKVIIVSLFWVIFLNVVALCFANTETTVSEDTTIVCHEKDFADGQDPILLSKSFLTSVAVRYAERLSGEWADRHLEMIRSGVGKDSDIYAELLTILTEYAVEIRSRGMYTLLFANALGMETVFDTYKGAKTFGTHSPHKEIFNEVRSGTPAAESQAWRDENGELFLSAFAAIYDSACLFVAILGVDYPAPEFEEFPELIKE